MQPIYTYHLSHYQLLSRHVSQLILQAENDAHMAYQAGQYVKLLHKDNSHSPMSIACAPADPAVIELHVSHPPKNHQAHDILRLIKQEAQLQLRGPYGDCTLQRMQLDTPIIFFVRGTGIAPVKSILEALETAKSNVPAMHLYWAAAPEDFYLQALVKKWQKNFSDFQYTQIPSRSVDQHKLQHAIMSDHPDLSGFQVYASGSVEMIQQAAPAFLQHGLEQKHFYSDIFSYDPSA